MNAWCGKLLGRTNTVHEGSVHGDNKKTRTQDFVFLFVFGWCEQRVGIASRRYYGGDGSIFLQVSGYSGFITLEIIIDYMWYTCIFTHCTQIAQTCLYTHDIHECESE